MSAVEELQQAIDTLERLKGKDEPWELLGGGEYIAPIGIGVASDDDGVTPREANLIVALHRTIDAQVAILRTGAVYVHNAIAGDLPDAALDLARAINGGAS